MSQHPLLAFWSLSTTEMPRQLKTAWFRNPKIFSSMKP